MRLNTRRPRSRGSGARPATSALLLLVLAAAGCEDGTGPPENVIRVEGTVTRLHVDSVVVGAEIIVDVLGSSGERAWARDSTDANGVYQLEVSVPGGCKGGSVTFAVQATAVDHASLKLGRPASPLAAVCGETTGLDLDLYRTVFRSPQPVAGNLTVTQLSVGFAHACAIASGGAYCWGWSAWGRLGNASVTAEYVERPVTVTSGSGFTQVAAGQHHSCALDGDGAAWCWGDNAWGQVGADTSVLDVAEPFRVRTDLRFVQIAAGRWHSCGLTADGVVYCWGSDRGTGTGGEVRDTIYSTPQPVALDGQYVAISSQFSSACALRDTGDLYCWGYSYRGELGAGEERGYHTTPLLVAGHQWSQVEAGRTSACALTASDAAYCWGTGWHGQLGNGDLLTTDTPVAVAGGGRWASISAGGTHACALTDAGVGWCWGKSERGALGTPPGAGEACTYGECFATPVRVPTDLTFTTLQAGDDYTCGITTGQALVCWGVRELLGSGRPLRPGTLGEEVRP